MSFRFFRKKRVFALLLIGFLLLLFYNSHWMGHYMYPVKYEDQILKSADEQQTDPYLLAAIVRVESNYTADKVSSKGAVGLMQIMPDTANWMAGAAGYQAPIEDKLMDPETNIDIGARYVRSLTEQFEHLTVTSGVKADRLAVVAAAYNAGPGNVTKWLQSGEWTGFYKDIEMIPYGETRHFVQRIIYYYNKYQTYYGDDWGTKK